MAMQQGTEVWRGQVRMPKVISDWIQTEAKKNFRSTNAEIVELLKEAKNNAGQKGLEQ